MLRSLVTRERALLSKKPRGKLSALWDIIVIGFLGSDKEMARREG